MARMVPQKDFEQLEQLAANMLAEARELVRRHGAIVPAGAGPAEVTLNEEVQALSECGMALAKASPLVEPALFVAMGAMVGVILAQSEESHAELLRLMRHQEKLTYDEVRRAVTPPTPAVN